MIWRDDDIGYLTNVDEFIKVHEIFNEHNCIHTIAVLTKDIHRNKPLIDYIKSQKNFDIQVHSYEHIDFAHATEEEIRFQLSKSVDIITNLFGNKPKFFYPTFNSINDDVIRIALSFGLTTSYEKASALYYLRHDGNITQNVINFHYHDYIESILIGPCLKLYNEKK